VVGAGPAGLAVGSALAAHGLDALLLDRGERIGDSWRGHYDSLRLNTVRWLSGLPYMAIPRSAGRFPSRDAFVAYLERYAARFRLDVRLGIDVERLERVDGGWQLLAAEQTFVARTAVVATGPCREPQPGSLDASRFRGPVLHASAYRDAGSFRGRDVLVVGGGNSGADIALDLARGSASCVRLAVRTPPHIVPRTVLGLPAQALGVAAKRLRLPPSATDRLFAALRAVFLGDLERLGLPSPELPLLEQFSQGDVVPIVDAGFVRAVREGQIGVVPAVTSLAGDSVLLEGGLSIRPEIVILATGYRASLEPLVGHLGLLDDRGRPLVHGASTHPAAPGLHFIGFTNPLSGNLRELGLDARAIARRIAAGRRSAPAPVPARPRRLSKEVVP
jgi:putative flavoprotein involved in K+ transport